MALTDADMVEFEDAAPGDLVSVVRLLHDDELGTTREADVGHEVDAEALVPYRQAFRQIDDNPDHRLIVGRFGGRVVSCLELAYLPSLTHRGTMRAQIEGVRVAPAMRGRGVGYVMIWWAIEQARERGCGLVQLTTDRRRDGVERFYAKHGFSSTHHGLKLDLRQGCLS